MYCVRYKNDTISFGFIRPWNAVRNDEIYSLNFLPPSMLDGISKDLECDGKILRSKICYDGYGSEFVPGVTFFSSHRDIKMFEGIAPNGGQIWKYKKEKEKEKQIKTITVPVKNPQPLTKQCLVNPEIVLGFEKYSDALNAIYGCIYVGQMEYPIHPIPFKPNSESDSISISVNESDYIYEMDDSSFNELQGVECIECDESEEYSYFCGFNRFRDNSKMYVKISRIEWMD